MKLPPLKPPVLLPPFQPGENSDAGRRRFLGGSDVAAVMGVSPWTTPVELYMKKTGVLIATDAEIDEKRQRRFRRGHMLEPFIVQMVVDKLQEMGLRVEVVATNQRYQDGEFDFLRVEIDFELRLWGTVFIGGGIGDIEGGHEVVFEGEHINADAKSVTGFAKRKWGEENTEDVPIEYAAQFMTGLMVTGRRYCLVGALLSFDDVQIHWLRYDEETVAAMRPKLESFWFDHVIKRVPPDPMKFSDIKLIFPFDNGNEIVADEVVMKAVENLQIARDTMRKAEEAAEVLTFEIGEFISPNSVLTYKDKIVATWKAQVQSKLDPVKLANSEIYERRVLRRGPNGEELDIEFERILDPIERFKTRKSFRVLKLKKPKKSRTANDIFTRSLFTEEDIIL